jgi:hypothetical protein
MGRVAALGTLSHHTMHIHYTLILSAVLLCGCSRTSVPSTDLGASLKKELENRGVSFTETSTLPAIHAEWTITPDDHGFVAFVAGDHFGDVDAWLHQAFGEPKMSIDKNSDGQPQRVYDLGAAGLQCIGETNGVRIICVKKQAR